MKILKVAVIALIGIVVLLTIVGLLLPATVHVERARPIDAPAYTIFALVDSMAAFNLWSPWHGRDPATEYSYEGPDYGVGATMHWRSDQRDVGSGTQRITASEPYETVRTELDFGPQGTAEGYLTIEPGEQGCTVTWGFDTDFGYDLFGRYLGFFLFDAMLGPDFEAGLTNLQKVAEALPHDDWTGLDVEVVETEPATIVYVSSESGPDPEAIGQALTEAYATVVSFIRQNGLQPAGPPLAITNRWDDTGYAFDAGIPIVEAGAIEPDPGSPVRLGSTYTGKAVKVVHVGPYEALPETWAKAFAFVEARGYVEADRSWEAYISVPEEVPEEELLTHIIIPVKRATPPGGAAEPEDVQ